MSLPWPDLVIGAVLILGALKGFKRGFIGELTGFVALACGITAAFVYPGSWDGFARDWFHLGPGSAHVVGMILYGSLVYWLIFGVGFILNRVANCRSSESATASWEPASVSSRRCSWSG